jgi:DNA-binding NtrC family response regulator
MSARVLIVDDDATIRASLLEGLAREDIEVIEATNAESALGLIETASPDLVLTDVRMPGMTGLELLRLLRERSPATDVVLMTAYDEMFAVVEAMREGAVDFLVKPLDLHELRRVVDRTLEDRRTRARARRSGAAVAPDAATAQPAGIIGRDPRMIAVYKLVGQLAANRATVLVRGESGTGKELIARTIHAASPDRDQPFVPVNCTSLPSTLLESELFGHMRGAFTGAIATRRGRFALAGRGTIFLDEIGDTSLEFQAKLLRVLEDGEFFPVGAERAERTDARLMTATHRNLEVLVDRGRFRLDLYYRLRVVEIILPPLRDRISDLPELARHLVRRAAEALGRAEAPVLSNEALGELMRRDWPGNVRELKNVLTRAVVLASGNVIRAEQVEPDPARSGRIVTLREMERAHIERAMQSTRGHKTRAARLLGISRPRLNRLLQAHGLEPNPDAARNVEPETDTL